MAAPGKQPVAGAISPAAEQMMRETSPFENSDCSSLYCLPETTQQYQICSKGMFKSSAIQSWADNWQILKDKHIKFFASPHTNIPSKCTTALKRENWVHRGYHREESHSPLDFLKDLLENTGLNADKITIWKISSARLGQNFRFHENCQFFLLLLSDVCDSSLTFLPPCNSNGTLFLLRK